MQLSNQGRQKAISRFRAEGLPEARLGAYLENVNALVYGGSSELADLVDVMAQTGDFGPPSGNYDLDSACGQAIAHEKHRLKDLSLEEALCLEKELWRQRTKQLALLLFEGRDRLAEGAEADEVEEWLNELDTGWVAEAKRMRPVPGNILEQIEKVFGE